MDAEQIWKRRHSGSEFLDSLDESLKPVLELIKVGLEPEHVLGEEVFDENFTSSLGKLIESAIPDDEFRQSTMRHFSDLISEHRPDLNGVECDMSSRYGFDDTHSKLLSNFFSEASSHGSTSAFISQRRQPERLLSVPMSARAASGEASLGEVSDVVSSTEKAKEPSTTEDGADGLGLPTKNRMLRLTPSTSSYNDSGFPSVVTRPTTAAGSPTEQTSTGSPSDRIAVHTSSDQAAVHTPPGKVHTSAERVNGRIQGQSGQDQRDSRREVDIRREPNLTPTPTLSGTMAPNLFSGLLPTKKQSQHMGEDAHTKKGLNVDPKTGMPMLGSNPDPKTGLRKSIVEQHKGYTVMHAGYENSVVPDPCHRSFGHFFYVWLWMSVGPGGVTALGANVIKNIIATIQLAFKNQAAGGAGVRRQVAKRAPLWAGADRAGSLGAGALAGGAGSALTRALDGIYHANLPGRVGSLGSLAGELFQPRLSGKIGLALITAHIMFYLITPINKGRTWKLPFLGLLPVVWLQEPVSNGLEELVGSGSENRKEISMMDVEGQSIDAPGLAHGAAVPSIRGNTVSQGTSGMTSSPMSPHLYPTFPSQNRPVMMSMISGPLQKNGKSNRPTFVKNRAPTLYLVHPHGAYCEGVGTFITTISLLQQQHILPVRDGTKPKHGSSLTMLYDKLLVKSAPLGMFFLALSGANGVDFLDKNRATYRMKTKEDLSLMPGGFHETNLFKKDVEAMYLGVYPFWLKLALEYGYAIEVIRMYNGATLHGGFSLNRGLADVYSEIVKDAREEYQEYLVQQRQKDENMDSTVDSIVHNMGDLALDMANDSRGSDVINGNLIQSTTGITSDKTMTDAQVLRQHRQAAFTSAIKSSSQFKISNGGLPALQKADSLLATRAPSHTRGDRFYVRSVRYEPEEIKRFADKRQKVAIANGDKAEGNVWHYRFMHHIEGRLKEIEKQDRAFVQRNFGVELPYTVWAPPMKSTEEVKAKMSYISQTKGKKPKSKL